MSDKSIRERVMKHTKEELQDACCRLGLAPLTRKAVKADWAAYIEEQLPMYINNIILQLRKEEYLALSDRVREAGACIPLGEARADECMLAALEVLASYGLAWRDTHAWRLNEDGVKLLTPDKQLLEDLDFHDILYDEMQGWLLHLGMMPMDDLLERVADVPELSQEQRESVRDRCFAILIARDGLECIFPDDSVSLGWVVHEDVADPEQLLDRLKTPAIAVMDYPLLTTDQLIRTQRFLAVPGDPALYKPVKDWLCEHEDMDEAECADTLEAIVYLIQNDDFSEAVDCLLDSVELRSDKDARRCMEALQKVVNHMPLWSNKGRSAAEMAQKLSGKGMPQMPGRNDPCTCGSGRKYKHCCGRRVN